MTILIFLLILAVLIFVHELGHFLAAKYFGIRVDEFALGFPPTIAKFKKGETTYALNAIPFGGYVKIFGEDPNDESMSGPDSSRSFVNKPKYIQAIVLTAGVVGNIVLAWLIITSGFILGAPSAVDDTNRAYVQNPQFTLVMISGDSPAEAAGFKLGDQILKIESGSDVLNAPITIEGFQQFVASHKDVEISITYKRGQEITTAAVTPKAGIIPGEPDRAAIGVSPAEIGTLKLPIHKALWEGTKFTGILIKETAVGLSQFLYRAVTGNANFSEVTGPVGIANLVGDASRLGIAYLLTLTAFISINLAIINLIPFPALDGGRLLFILIEKIKGSPLSPKFANTANAIGFVILIIFMLVVTYQDVARLFIK